MKGQSRVETGACWVRGQSTVKTDEGWVRVQSQAGRGLFRGLSRVETREGWVKEPSRVETRGLCERTVTGRRRLGEWQ